MITKQLKIFLTLVITFILAIGIFSSNKVFSQKNDFPFYGDYSQDELLVKFKNDISAQATFSILNNKNNKVSSKGIYKVKTQNNESLGDLYKNLKANPLVDYVAPNYKVKISAIPNDTYYSSQWDLTKMSASSGWDKTNGNSSIKIGVIDTGVDYNHEDLSSKIWTNPGETGMTQPSDRCWTGVSANKQTNNCDDDNNGYIDDYHGWDFAGTFIVTGGLCSVPGETSTCHQVNGSWLVGYWRNPNDASDDNNHGTAVSGIIAATTNNGKGVSGIDWNAKIVPLKVMDASGSGNESSIISALDYAKNNGISVVNMSLGIDGTTDPSNLLPLQNAIASAYNSNLIMVASAGNDYSSNIEYPAKYSQVLSVGSTNSSDVKSNFSNSGSELDVVAPGENIYTTDRTGSLGYNSGNISYGDIAGNYYKNFSGTSAATPNVTGLVSLLKGSATTYTNQQVMDTIENSTDKVAGMNGQNFTNNYGYGRININKTLSTLTYSWQYSTQTASKTTLSPGETATLSFGALNTGNTTWSNTGLSPTRVGTTNPKDRVSTFADPSWIAPFRPVAMTEASVGNGQVAHFTWTIKAPSKPGVYREYYSVMIEGIGWLNDPGMYYEITVSPPTYSWQYSTQTASKTTLSPGETATLSFGALNTGNTTWSNTGLSPTRVGTTNPKDRVSTFADPSWIAPFRPVAMTEASVGNGQVAHFTWTIKAPSKPGVYREYYSVMIEGIGWLNDPGMYYEITVNGNYAWTLVGQSSSKGGQPDSLQSVSYGDTATLSFRAQNTGSTIWYSDGPYPTRVGTTNSRDRASSFADSSWLGTGKNRPATMVPEIQGRNYVAPGEFANFTWTIQAPSVPGVYREYFSLMAEGFGWFNDPGMYYQIVVGWTDNLNGLVIPATSGAVGKEQHLYLNSTEANDPWGKNNPDLHYYETNLNGLFPGITAVRNGMAGGYGAFGAIANYNLPVNDERYYINMRWNYTTWYNGTLGDPAQMYCGSNYAVYSIAYYGGYQYGGQYCVPKTYTSGDNGTKSQHYLKKVLVINPVNGKKLIASVLESGPAIFTGRVSGLSPEAMYVLGANTNDTLQYHWYLDQSAAAGPLN